MNLSLSSVKMTWVFATVSYGDITSLLFWVESKLTGRDHLWTLSLNLIRDHPLFGIGPGAYKYEMLNYFPVLLDSWVGGLFLNLYEITNGSNASHNFYLFFFSDMGLLGIFTALTFTALYFMFGIKTVNKYKGEKKDTYYLVIALFVAGTSMFIRALTDSIGLLYYGAITADLPFWLVFSSLIYYYSNHSINPASVDRKTSLS